MTNLPIRLRDDFLRDFEDFLDFGFAFLAGLSSFSGLGTWAWASVWPIRKSVVPHTGQDPLLPGVPVLV
ncbi:MAG: hypothetical protein OXG60_11440 [Chloroflexi bacterium]|nr:hypothetical protein [Chloroflexota bacterium]